MNPFEHNCAIEVFNQLNSLVIIINLDGEIQFVNKPLEDTIGYSCEDLLGKVFWNHLIPPKDSRNVQEKFLNLTSPEGKTTGKGYWLTQNQQKRLMEWNGSLTHNITGMMNSVIISGVDVTDREEQKYLFDTYKKTVDSFLVFTTTDKNGTITYVNDLFCELSGYTRDELVGKTHRVVNSGFHNKFFFKELWDKISSGKTWVGDIKNRKKDGSFYWVSTSITSIKNYKGEIVGYVSLRADITEKQQLEDDLLLASQLSALGEISGNILHEVSNPLSILQSQAQLVKKLVQRDQIEKPELLERIEKLVHNSSRITHIFKNMRNSLVANNDHVEFESCSLYQILQSTVSLLDFQIQKEKVELIFSEENLNVAVDCNKCAIGQIFLNLIKNSIDAMKHSEKKIIQITCEQQDERIKLFFQDSGPGIPPDLKTKIFESRFTTKKLQGGTGYGLNISQRLMKIHGGHITVVNNDHPGACFELEFPLPETKGSLVAS